MEKWIRKLEEVDGRSEIDSGTKNITKTKPRCDSRPSYFETGIRLKIRPKNS